MKFKFRVKCALWLQIHTLFIHFGSLDLLVSCGVLSCCMTSVCFRLTWNWPFCSFYSGVALPHSASTGNSFPQVSFSLLNHECSLNWGKLGLHLFRCCSPFFCESMMCSFLSWEGPVLFQVFHMCGCRLSLWSLRNDFVPQSKERTESSGLIAVFLLMNQIKSQNVVFTSVVFFYYWHLCDDVKHVTDKYAKTCEIRTHSTIFRFGMQC